MYNSRLPPALLYGTHTTTRVCRILILRIHPFFFYINVYIYINVHNVRVRIVIPLPHRSNNTIGARGVLSSSSTSKRLSSDFLLLFPAGRIAGLVINKKIKKISFSHQKRTMLFVFFFLNYLSFVQGWNWTRRVRHTQCAQIARRENCFCSSRFLSNVQENNYKSIIFFFFLLMTNYYRWSPRRILSHRSELLVVSVGLETRNVYNRTYDDDARDDTVYVSCIKRLCAETRDITIAIETRRRWDATWE